MDQKNSPIDIKMRAILYSVLRKEIPQTKFKRLQKKILIKVPYGAILTLHDQMKKI